MNIPGTFYPDGSVYGSWDLFHKGIKEHDAFVCDNCKNVISYGYFIESEE